MEQFNDIRRNPRVSAAQPHQAGKPSGRRGVKLSKKMILLWCAVMVLIATGITAWLLYSGSTRVNADRYQAVFLSSGQVYFGKLHGFGTNQPYLTEVYYFPGGDEKTVNSQPKLVKLGQEVHAPEAEILLNKDSIQLVENLTTDSPIVKAITDGQKASTTAPSGGVQR